METGNQEKTVVEQDQTFTQAEVDRIVGERLARERAKFEDYETLKEKAEKYDAAEEASKTELEKATERANELQQKVNRYESEEKIRKVREKVAKEAGVPAELLVGETEEECKEWAKKLEEHYKPSSYPRVKDAGEPRHKTGKMETRDLFAEWFAEQNG